MAFQANGHEEDDNRACCRSGLTNLLKMGHCAQAVMQTILDLGNTKEEWLVRMTTGLPGGIGNTGLECGGITSPLIQSGLEHGLSAKIIRLCLSVLWNFHKIFYYLRD